MPGTLGDVGGSPTRTANAKEKMIQSITVTHHTDVVALLVWQNGQMTTPTLDPTYSVIPGINDLIITHNKGVIEPTLGRLIATCLFGTGGDIVSVTLNADHYGVVAVNSDGFIKTYGAINKSDQDNEADVGTHHTMVEETWTRNNHP